ncbi:hypothetical protein [Piscirickettsia litoralis]|uniref:Pilus assembly protein PilM n=1 Tax=Piscirickettsia litoralis TaxID=1891921 RepID=A0ABX3A4E4_9GAMM|nr:hypothetical protein [Piscirickettsia litoralis]ODN43117.1 hypothetical protein BGC07_09600 [Piscirickettsia litoralis]
MLFLARKHKKYRQVGINWDRQCLYIAESEWTKCSGLKLANYSKIPFKCALEQSLSLTIKKCFSYLNNKKIVLSLNYQNLLESRTEVDKKIKLSLCKKQAMSNMAAQWQLDVNSLCFYANYFYSNKKYYLDIIAVRKLTLYQLTSALTSNALSVFAVNVDIYALFDLCQKLIPDKNITDGLVVKANQEGCLFYLIDNEKVYIEPIFRQINDHTHLEKVIGEVAEVVNILSNHSGDDKIMDIFIFGSENIINVKNFNVYNLSKLIKGKFDFDAECDDLALALALSYRAL